MQPSSAWHGKRVLVLEDDFLIALELSSGAARLGLQVVGPFGSLAKARATIGESTFSVALLDVNIRGTSSLAFAAELVELRIPCIFITGYSKIPDLPQSLAHVPVVGKPIVDSELRRALALAFELP